MRSSTPGLGPGQKSDDTTPVAIPLGTTPGSSFLIAVADADDAIAEGDETINTRSKALTVK